MYRVLSLQRSIAERHELRMPGVEQLSSAWELHIPCVLATHVWAPEHGQTEGMEPLRCRDGWIETPLQKEIWESLPDLNGHRPRDER